MEREANSERQLLIDSRAFAVEVEKRSWYELIVTLVALTTVVAVGFYNDGTVVRLCVSLVLALLFVRMFAIYHDFMHSSIFKKSPLAAAILKFFGLLLLTPPSVWKRSHDYHHKNNSKLFGTDIGSFKVMTVDCYRESNWRQKFEYRLSRSLFVMFAGYFFVFLWGMTIVPLIRSPQKHLDSLASLGVHFSAGAGLLTACGWHTFLFLFALPMLIAMAFGTYLFYIQHNFVGVRLTKCPDWTYTKAALRSSSFLKAGTVINWFTANIGFHHVHHLNAKIPFYRLAEAHHGLPPMQSAVQTTLSVGDIVRSLQLKLWDDDSQSFVGFSNAKT